MVKDERENGQGPEAGTEGGPRPTGVPASGPAAVGSLAPGQRWTVAKKRDIVLRIFRGESMDKLSRELGVEIYRLEEWRDAALGGIDVALKSRHGDPLKESYEQAMKRVGELTMEIEVLWQRVRQPSPLAGRRSKK